MYKKLFLQSLMLIILSIPAWAESFTYKYRGIDFRCVVKKNVATITAFPRESANVIIPASVTNPKTGRTYNVHTLDLSNVYYIYKTKAVAIEEGILNIDKYCFRNFYKLEQVYIPNSIEYISGKAFRRKHLPSFKMPATIKEEDLQAGLDVYTGAGLSSRNLDPTLDNDVAAYMNRDNAEESDGSAVDISEGASLAVRETEPGSSDIDYGIPTTGSRRENTFCIILANEKYSQQDTPNVKYAAQDGKTFYQYCISTLGIPRENIKHVTNAKYLQIKDALGWLHKLADVYGKESNFIIYYSGHGVPDEKGHCNLVPVDVSINDAENCYSIRHLYDALGALNTESALVILDACFSGNSREGVCALDEVHKGIVRDIKQETVKGNVVVMSAATNTETALVYSEKAHSLFSYYLMKKLQDTRGNVTYGDLFDYVQKEVRKKSIVLMDKLQTPSISYSNNLSNTWKQLKF